MRSGKTISKEAHNYIRMLRRLKPFLKEEFKVLRIGIFGSVIRGEEKCNSDIDIIVEFQEPIGLKIFDLIEFLEKKLGRKVDLVSTEGVSPYIKPYIEKDVIFA